MGKSTISIEIWQETPFELVTAEKKVPNKHVHHVAVKVFNLLHDKSVQVWFNECNKYAKNATAMAKLSMNVIAVKRVMEEKQSIKRRNSKLLSRRVRIIAIAIVNENQVERFR